MCGREKFRSAWELAARCSTHPLGFARSAMGTSRSPRRKNFRGPGYAASVQEVLVLQGFFGCEGVPPVVLLGVSMNGCTVAPIKGADVEPGFRKEMKRMNEFMRQIAQTNAAVSGQAAVTSIGGGFGAPEDLVAAKMAQEKEWRLAQAFQTLLAAWKVRQDKELMADLRPWLQRQPKDLARFLDDVGAG